MVFIAQVHLTLCGPIYSRLVRHILSVSQFPPITWYETNDRIVSLKNPKHPFRLVSRRTVLAITRWTHRPYYAKTVRRKTSLLFCVLPFYSSIILSVILALYSARALRCEISLIGCFGLADHCFQCAVRRGMYLCCQSRVLQIQFRSFVLFETFFGFIQFCSFSTICIHNMCLC